MAAAPASGPWWRNVNMARIENVRARLSQDPSLQAPAAQAPMMRPVDAPVIPTAVPVTETLPTPVTTEPIPRPVDTIINDVASCHPSEDTSTTVPANTSTNGPPAQSESPAMIERVDSATEAVDPNPDIENPHPPSWYTIPADQPQKKRIPVGIEQSFNVLKASMTRCVKASEQGRTMPASDLQEINRAIHRAPFLTVDKFIIRKSRLLFNKDGLPQLFSGPASQKFPWYIVEDAAELYTKWWLADFSSDLYRGIDVGRKKDQRLGRDAKAAKLIPKYANKRSGNFAGNGHLRNGQWWPTQLCAVRDGAHNATVAGICGDTKTGNGAFSCVMSGGPYENIDNGDEVQYYGTQSDDPLEASRSTQILKMNIGSGQPVRLLRSSKIVGDNPYKPKEGLRYDGLYKVTGFEVTDATKQVHRFRLVREPGQGSIRYKGPEKRPTAEELAALEKSNKERGFLV